MRRTSLLLTIVALLCVVTSVEAQKSAPKAPQRQNYNDTFFLMGDIVPLSPLYGDVESLTISYDWGSESDYRNSDAKASEVAYLRFNKRGDVVEKCCSVDWGFSIDTLYQYCYEYDSNGRLITREYYNDVHNSRDKVRIYYDNDGRIIKELYLDNLDNNRGEKILTYDAAGRQVKDVRLDSNGTEKESKTWLYDAQGRCTQYCQWRKGELVTLRESEYNDKGLLVEEREYGPDKSPRSTITLEYYDNDKLAIKTHRWADSSRSSVTTYIYIDGQLAEENSCGMDGRLLESKKYKYYSNGKLYESETFVRHTTGVPYNIHRYDSNGNLIESIGRYGSGDTRNSYYTRYEYNDYGGKVYSDSYADEIRVMHDSKPHEEVIQTFDDQHNIISRIELEHWETSTKTTYYQYKIEYRK